MTKIKRRDFLKGAVGAAALLSLDSGEAKAVTHGRGHENVGILYDSTLCVGCNACMSACKEANNMPVDSKNIPPVQDTPTDLSVKTLNIIKKYSDGTAEVKDREKDGYAFIKRQCLHCVEPGCATACPVSALHKDEKSGVVKYNKNACIGCRYCQIACPYNIPKFEWYDWYPQIVKCQLCDHLVEHGGVCACCEVCPTGAALFGKVDDLLKESKRRLMMKPGEEYEFPTGSIDSGRTTVHEAAEYVQHVYGEKELGGTQVMYMSAVPFDKFGLPKVGEDSYAAMTNSIQGTLYHYMVLPATVFTGLAYVIKKNLAKQKDAHGADSNHGNQQEGGK